MVSAYFACVLFKRIMRAEKVHFRRNNETSCKAILSTPVVSTPNFFEISKSFDDFAITPKMTSKCYTILPFLQKTLS